MSPKVRNGKFSVMGVAAGKTGKLQLLQDPKKRKIFLGGTEREGSSSQGWGELKSDLSISRKFHQISKLIFVPVVEH